MGSNSTKSQIKLIIPVRNPDRELYNLIRPNRIWPRVQSALGVTGLDGIATLEQSHGQVVEQQVAMGDLSQAPVDRTKQRFVRTMYLEDDGNDGYSGDDEFSDVEKDLEGEDSTDLESTHLDSQECEFNAIIDSCEPMELVDENEDSDLEGVQSIDDSMTEEQFAEWMLNPRGKATTQAGLSAPGLDWRAFKVPPKDKVKFSNASADPSKSDGSREKNKVKVVGK
ncbi:hypothetical protein G7Z17_g12704 [Cylindrodendrum hubeiense]|uniref:Uncharacterized protein n=1 Tax=Cylindrodendrum hubeiense TaxID=595255 RepID=A0A9P5GV10_9HYPO|nr:hypothetical protein G7Z17_g12704 [Cylindrodendrum hubeiense]